MDEELSEGEKSPGSPVLINAFQLIGMSSCLDLSGFFEKEDISERKIRFTSNHCMKDLLAKIEDIVTEMGFQVIKKNGKLKVLRENRDQRSLGSLSVAAEVLEISPSLYVVELRKSYGDPSVYRQLCEKLSNDLGVPPIHGLLTTEV
uniref:non-specific serine/threonine protein kinase n=1 Tax=Rhizophora mucronata TaxID=61149 RepID=A0A2P2INU0_RHIMU